MTTSHPSLRVDRRASREACTDFATGWHLDKIKVGEPIPDRYTALANAAKDLCMARAVQFEVPGFGPGAALGGMNAQARLLSRLPTAYVTACRTQSQQPELSELSLIARNSRQLPSFFAGMDFGRNRIWEEFFGIRGLPPRQTPFTIVDLGSESARAEVEPELANFVRASIQAKLLLGSSEVRETDSHEQCPAQAIIAVTWPAMAATAAEDPRFYATDLATLVN